MGGEGVSVVHAACTGAPGVGVGGRDISLPVGRDHNRWRLVALGWTGGVVRRGLLVGKRLARTITTTTATWQAGVVGGKQTCCDTEVCLESCKFQRIKKSSIAADDLYRKLAIKTSWWLYTVITTV